MVELVPLEEHNRLTVQRPWSGVRVPLQKFKESCEFWGENIDDDHRSRVYMMLQKLIYEGDVALQRHSDDDHVDNFAKAMKEKLFIARGKGRSNWEGCDPKVLSYMLRDHIEKGDPVDVANFCMFLYERGFGIDPGNKPAPIYNLLMPDGDPRQASIRYTEQRSGNVHDVHIRVTEPQKSVPDDTVVVGYWVKSVDSRTRHFRFEPLTTAEVGHGYVATELRVPKDML